MASSVVKNRPYQYFHFRAKDTHLLFVAFSQSFPGTLRAVSEKGSNFLPNVNFFLCNRRFTAFGYRFRNTVAF
jgi:hypothetical protein